MVLEHGHWRHVRRDLLRSYCVSLYCCKGTPCTFPFWLLISDSSSELKLMLKLNYFNWTRLEVSTSDCRLLSRLHDCGLRMSPIRFKEILRMIPPWRESQGSGRRSPPLARGFPSSTSRWDGTIWDQYQRGPNFGEIPGPELGDEPPLRAGSLPKRRKDVASWRCRKKLRTGLGNKYSLANMAITADVCMCTRKVRSDASLMRLQRSAIPQDASNAHLSCPVARL